MIEKVARDASGETVCGFRVAAYRETHPEHGDKFGHTYSEHWSTPNWRHPNVKVERLFTEDQLRAAIEAMPLNELREALQTNVMKALWPIMGGNHTEADTWGEIGDAMQSAIDAALERVSLSGQRHEPTQARYEAIDRIEALEREVEQAQIDILCVLGACRDNMPSEAVEVFQRIARSLGASLSNIDEGKPS